MFLICIHAQLKMYNLIIIHPMYFQRTFTVHFYMTVTAARASHDTTAIQSPMRVLVVVLFKSLLPPAPGAGPWSSLPGRRSTKRLLLFSPSRVTILSSVGNCLVTSFMSSITFSSLNPRDPVASRASSTPSLIMSLMFIAVCCKNSRRYFPSHSARSCRFPMWFERFSCGPLRHAMR